MTLMNKFVTLPVEKGHEGFSLELAKKLGADALRNSDGTDLPEEFLQENYDIYSTLCIVRADQEWARSHMDHCIEKYLMSEAVTAMSETIDVDIMGSFFREKYTIDKQHDPYQYWEVIDRTSGDVVDKSLWSFDPETELVNIKNCCKYHRYTVSFLAYQIWDTTSMYNHITNNWTCEHIVSIDPYIPESYNHMMEYLENWLDNNQNVDVVRLTSLAYSFTLDSDQNGKPKFVDWLGYTDCVSPMALDDFEKEYGYRLRPEDFVNNGYYNSTQLVPSKQYRDWMDFIHRFVNRFGQDIVRRIHARGKKSALFWGDHWIGVETYSELFKDMGIDINIGACEDGNALRRLADCPAECTREIRLYPYFFPDVFCDGGTPTKESISNWMKIRRAMLRKPVDRIGWGGYLSLIENRPDFVEHIQGIADEFRSILDKGAKTAPYSTNVKVVILNSWGNWRSWINTINPEQQFSSAREDVVTIFGSNMLECLSGLPVDVSFLSFDKLLKNGIPAGTDVIINEGAAGNAWSGGDYWKKTELVEKIREFTAQGGGLIGIGSPSAVEYQGTFFQLADIFGVDKELGRTVDRNAMTFNSVDNHFITEDIADNFDAGTTESFVRLTDSAAVVIAAEEGHITASVKEYGEGRGVYLAGLPYSCENSRLLYRSILWAAGQGENISKCFSDNPYTDCAVFPETGYLAVANNSGIEQHSLVTDCKNNKMGIDLKPYELKWIKY
jgi:1,3-beta-galactosyl-N-acetylhexosamine phosphorylase